MADVFEKEGSPTQDATYREHLDRNWEAGNRKFAELEGKVQDMQKQVAKLNLAVFGNGAVPVDTSDSNNQTNKAQEVHLD